MNTRFQTLVLGALLAAVLGWGLYIGKDVWIPVVFGAIVFYVIVGVSQALGRVPVVGPALPLQIKYAVSFLIIGAAVLAIGLLVAVNKEKLIAIAPQYEESFMTAIQKAAVWFHVETEPTWTSLRQELLARINVQLLVGSMLASVSSMAVSVVVVLLYAVFLLVERRSFAAKLANLSDDARRVARIGTVIEDINRRIGTYLVLKTFISVLLGVISWLIMLAFGLEFATFWAVLIGLLNFVPYIGSFLGVFFPAIMTIVQFNDMTLILSMLAALTAAQFVIGNFLDPYMMGNSLNLSPFAILVSLAIWSALWGIPGAFLAVPVTAIVVVVLSQFPGSRPIAVLLSRDGRL
jgi:AI-2 transport protein TqsA